MIRGLNFSRVVHTATQSPIHKGLFLSNGLTLVLALIFQWPLTAILWAFWFQSFFIGLFLILRLLVRLSGESDTSPNTRNLLEAMLLVFLGLFFCMPLFTALSISFLAWSSTPTEGLAIIVCGALAFLAEANAFYAKQIVEKKMAPADKKKLKKWLRRYAIRVGAIVSTYCLGLFFLFLNYTHAILVLFFMGIKMFVDYTTVDSTEMNED